MSELPRVLIVDDEQSILNAFRRQLRKDFDVTTAVGAANGLFALKADEPFAVIVSDYLMPGINGADFLARVRRIAPESTRMLLTGHTDLGDAAVTVNDGQVFRMLLKPVSHEDMVGALNACVEQHRLMVAERELLEQTLAGIVRALTEVMALASPAAFARASRMRRTAALLLDHLDVADRWAVDLAVMMSQLGAVSLPPAVTDKLEAKEELNRAEQSMVNNIPQVGERLIAPIPRLESVAAAIRYCRKNFDGTGEPLDDVAGEDIPIGGRLIHLVKAYDDLICDGAPPAVARRTLESRAGAFDPAMLKVLDAVVPDDVADTVVPVMIDEIESGMVLAAPVMSRAGVFLMKADHEFTVSFMARVHNFAALEDGVAEPLMVYRSSLSPETREKHATVG
jgi:response regulator RpfG family c-di-GMP phosphodiesterase